VLSTLVGMMTVIELSYSALTDHPIISKASSPVEVEVVVKIEVVA
jgi:hypothetical protein